MISTNLEAIYVLIGKPSPTWSDLYTSLKSLIMFEHRKSDSVIKPMTMFIFSTSPDSTSCSIPRALVRK